MPDVRGRVRGPAIAAGTLLLALAMPALVLLPPARGADGTHETGGTDGTSGTSGSAEPVPAVSGAVPPPETGAGELTESIATYDVVLALGTDGVLRVRETITYDFGDTGRHGIVRQVPFRRGDRLYGIRGIRSSSSTGAPARVRTMKLLNDVQISVGGLQREVRGRQAYVIEYEVEGAFTPRPDHDVLVWDAIGTRWDVPIRNAAVRVEAPVPLRHVTCAAGTSGATTRCLRDRDGPYAVDFIQRTLAPHEGMKVRVRLPKHAVAVQPPRYVPPRWTGGWPGTALLVLSLGTVALLSRGPVPRRRAGPALAAAGVLLVAADAGAEVAAHGLWAFSLGDRCLAGLALVIVGAGAMLVHRFRAV
ncbi:DUF2207 domain-containing protein [Spirillospora sp. NPDC048824]|uniref:DUF2207 domain-containing protein n=1 Tax=Spirillospora sp. NPDC048824 TaxID=3364526 RepID=UPI00371B2A92